MIADPISWIWNLLLGAGSDLEPIVWRRALLVGGALYLSCHAVVLWLLASAFRSRGLHRLAVGGAVFACSGALTVVSALFMRRMYHPMVPPLPLNGWAGVVLAGSVCLAMLGGALALRLLARRWHSLAASAAAGAGVSLLLAAACLSITWRGVVSPQELEKAIRYGWVSRIRDIAAWGGDLDAPVDGMTPLELAVWIGNADVVRALFDGGATFRSADGTSLVATMQNAYGFSGSPENIVWLEPWRRAP